MSHQCPVTLPGGNQCALVIRNDDILMDPAHWRLVPKGLQRAVYAAFRNRQGLGTPELTRAQDAAIAAVEAALLARAAEPRPGRRA